MIIPPFSDVFQNPTRNSFISQKDNVEDEIRIKEEMMDRTKKYTTNNNENKISEQFN